MPGKQPYRTYKALSFVYANMEANPIVLCEKAERHDGVPDPIDMKPPSL